MLFLFCLFDGGSSAQNALVSSHEEKKNWNIYNFQWHQHGKVCEYYVECGVVTHCCCPSKGNVTMILSKLYVRWYGKFVVKFVVGFGSWINDIVHCRCVQICKYFYDITLFTDANTIIITNIIIFFLFHYNKMKHSPASILWMDIN